MNKTYDAEGCRLTDCCGVYSTHVDAGNENWTLCCKSCHSDVTIGEGDGSEVNPYVKKTPIELATILRVAQGEELKMAREALQSKMRKHVGEQKIEIRDYTNSFPHLPLREVK